VSKMSFFFTTLIAAIPAAFLGYLCVMAFLLHSDALGAVTMGITGLTLLLCVAVIAMPAAVLLKGRSAKSVSERSAADKDAVAETPSGEVAVDEEEAVVASEDGDVFVEGTADEFDDFEESKK
jgi:hypothetical protein